MKKTVSKRVSKVIKNRNAGTMSESMFWGMIRSLLRKRTQYWLPRINCLKDARRPAQSQNKRLKWEFLCSSCKLYFPQKEVEAHHLIEAGSLKSAEDLPSFIEKLFSETGWVCLCKACHLKMHKKP